MGTIAMIVSFAASCRAYRRRGLKWIASLYALVFLCHFFSFAELVVWFYMGWWWYYNDILFILVGVSSTLWLVCVILALSIPSFDTHTCSNNDQTTTNGPQGSAVYPAPSDNQDEGEESCEDENVYTQVKTVAAVPIPMTELEEPPSQNTTRFQKYSLEP